MAKNDEIVTMTRADLESAIKAGAEAAVAANRNTMGFMHATASQEEMIHAKLGMPVPERNVIKTMRQPCLNPRNGAKFVAIIVPSREWKEGRTVDLVDYQYPDDLEQRARKLGKRVHRQDFGGADPREPGKQGLTQEFLQWRYETYQLADRKAFVGESGNLLPRNGELQESPPTASARTVGEARLAG